MFGESVLDGAGQLDRAALARIVFKDSAALEKLEAILHPRILAEWIARLDQWETAGVPMAVVVIPLLFETGAEARFNATVCVACNPATQSARLQSRGWTEDEISSRSAAQMSVADKMGRADYVIWSEGSLEAHAGQVARIFSVP